MVFGQCALVEFFCFCVGQNTGIWLLFVNVFVCALKKLFVYKYLIILLEICAINVTLHQCVGNAKPDALVKHMSVVSVHLGCCIGRSFNHMFLLCDQVNSFLVLYILLHTLLFAGTCFGA